MVSSLQMQAIEHAVHMLDIEFARNVHSQDPASLVDHFYAEDAKVFAVGRPPVEGKTAILEYWKKVFEMGLKTVQVKTTFVDAEIDLAYATGNYSMTMEPEPGRQVSDEGKYVVVYRKQPDGKWRAVVDMFSSNH